MKNYNGGKSGNGTYQTIINHIPPHNIYVEPFAGHCGIFRKIRRAPLSILNDIDAQVIYDIKLYLEAIEDNCKVEINFMQGNLFEKPAKPVVILRNNDYSVIIDRLKDNPDAFIYCDPPYPMNKRISQSKLYKYDWEREEKHVEFLNKIVTSKAAVMISSYPNDLYNYVLSGWSKHEFYSTIHGGRKALEVIYMNYPKPVVLHDFQYLGANYRKREWLKNKVKRQLKKLNNLPEIERTAILSAIHNQFKDTIETLIKL